ncbi:MAG: type II secretion system F family protein [Candidatus Eremiobacterota bacterium]
MARFVFRATAPGGLVVEGAVRSPSHSQARRLLTESGLTVEQLEGLPWWMSTFQELVQPLKQPSGRELAAFFRQFAVLVQSGIPFTRVLFVLEGGGWSPALEGAARVLSNGVLEGRRLSAMLDCFPQLFPQACRSFVSMGEMSGQLGEALERAALLLERDFRLRHQVRSALAYPAFALAVFLVTGLFSVLFLLPRFAQVFDQANLPMPAPLAILVGLTRVLGSLAGLMLLVQLGALGLVLAWGAVRTDSGRSWLDRKVLRVPWLGALLLHVATARLSQSLASLVQAGVSLEQSLTASQGLAGNTELEERIERVRERLRGGGDLSDSLQRQGFPRPMVSLIRVGEECGQLDRVLSHVARFYEEEVRLSLATLLGLLEPLLVLFMGFAVAAFLVVMMLPMLKLSQALA